MIPITNIIKKISMEINNDLENFIVHSVAEFSGDELYQVNAKKIYEACQKQKAKKPPKHDVTVCPICNSKWDYGHPYTKYCCHCGQAILVEHSCETCGSYFGTCKALNKGELKDCIMWTENNE